MYETGEPRTLIKYGSNPAQNYKNAIDCIDRHLDANRPIMVGVNHTPGRGINEGATDHFIVINGRGYDTNTGMYYYTYYEVGRSTVDYGCDLNANRLIYNEAELLLYDNISQRSDSNRFDVTQVRPNDGNTTGTIPQGPKI